MVDPCDPGEGTDPSPDGRLRPHEPCELCGPPLELDGERQLALRHTTAADVDAIRDLYQRLGPDDIRRRFLTGGMPPPVFFERWARIGEEGGFGLAAELSTADRTELVAEAGYAPVAVNAVGFELGITVHPAFRGWLGPWLFDRLLAHAEERGVDRLQAMFLVENRPMMALIAKRGYETLEHPDWDVVRVEIPTTSKPPARRSK